VDDLRYGFLSMHIKNYSLFNDNNKKQLAPLKQEFMVKQSLPTENI
jgi:hypothetical protein